MKKLLLTVVLVFAAAAIFLGPPLRSAFAATEVDITLGRAPMHPTQAALNFMLDEPGDAALTAKKKTKLWATYYHMPTVRPSWTSVAAKPLIDRNGNVIGSYPSKIKPNDAQIIEKLESALAAKPTR